MYEAVPVIFVRHVLAIDWPVRFSDEATAVHSCQMLVRLECVLHNPGNVSHAVYNGITGTFEPIDAFERTLKNYRNQHIVCSVRSRLLFRTVTPLPYFFTPILQTSVAKIYVLDSLHPLDQLHRPSTPGQKCIIVRDRHIPTNPFENIRETHSYHVGVPITRARHRPTQLGE